MSRFTFLHAADLHLGSPLAGLASRNPELAERFMAAGRGAFTALVDHALATRPAFLLIAGDIFDGEWADHTIGLFFAREVARLERDNIPVAYVRGNHDAESVVRKAVTLPASTVEFPSRAAATHRFEELRVALHGRSFPDRTVPDDFVSGYPDPLPGWFNIGLLHTSCGGHPNHDTYAPCTPAQLGAKNYEYWALGHVHDYVEISRDPPIIYPGNLQGRSVKECGPKGAVAVDVADGRVTDLRRVVLDRARFATLDLVLDEHPDEAAVLAALSAALHPHVAEGEGRPIAVRITLRGATPLHDALAGDPERLEAELQAAAHRLHEEVWLERVRVRTSRPAKPVASEAGLLDPAALLAEVDRDEAFRERARAVIAEIGAKLPGGMAAGDEGALGEDLDQLLAEAEATVMARLSGRCG